MKLFPAICILLVGWLGLFSAPALGSQETLTLADGSSIKVLFFEPKAMAEKPHLALLISGSTSNTFMARAQFWLGKELVDRGWAIAVPISPDRTGFGGDNARLLPELVDIMQSTLGLSSRRPLLIGVSSGGSTALSIAAKYPTTFSGVVATPGILQEDQPIQSLQGLPIYLRIGERDDFRWNRLLEPMESRLIAAGAVVDAAIVADAKHIFPLDWDNLEIWLNSLQQPRSSGAIEP